MRAGNGKQLIILEWPNLYHQAEAAIDNELCLTFASSGASVLAGLCFVQCSTFIAKDTSVNLQVAELEQHSR